MKNKNGLYIHIPFCIKKCNYCNFLSAPQTNESVELYLCALEKEIRSYQKENIELRTIYIGGGTPSILSETQIERLFCVIKDSFDCRQVIEWTMEANPGTLTREKLQAIKENGGNRLSIGLQSADDKELKILGRVHTWTQFKEQYDCARKTGFSNISVDVMSALPGQSFENYQKTLKKVCDLNPEHISSYSLIIEENTPFFENKELKKQLPGEEEERKMYEFTKEYLQKYGYQRYEISNYAKEGYESRHNSSYWTGIPYIGAGLGASSYQISNNSCLRFQNTENMKKYLENAGNPEKLRENKEVLSVKDQIEEFMFLGLRMRKGVSKKEFFRRFQKNMEDVYADVLSKYEKMDLMKEEGDNVLLTDKGIDVSNYIFADFLLTNEMYSDKLSV